MDIPALKQQPQINTFANLMRGVTGAINNVREPVQNTLFNLLSGAYADRLLNKMGMEQPTINQLRQEMNSPEVQMAMSIMPIGMIAYHGSPHTFAKFSLDKIGTGEGAQAYGHGLYLAESPEVAGGYAKLGDRFVELNGRPVDISLTRNSYADNASDAERYAANAFARFDGNISDAVAFLSQKGNLRAEKEGAKILKRNASNMKVMGGQTYKTDIPDEAVARFLDWDKPLSEQAKEVQAALGKYVDTDKVKILDLIRKGEQPDGFGVVKSGNGYAPIIGGEVVGNGAKDLVFRSQDEAISYIANRIPATDPTAASIYRRMVGDHGGSDGISQAQVSGLLRQQGIPGIRYLDGGSRGAGSGTSNYVVFSPEMIRILERNGIPTGQQPWQPGEWK